MCLRSGGLRTSEQYHAAFRAPWICGFLSLVIGCLAGCTPDAADPRIQIQLNWFPDPEFGGYYAALLHGDYAAEGLNVEVVAGGPDVSVIPKLALGRVEFGVANADEVLLARKEGADIVAVMAVMQDSPRCIMVHESSGIRSLDQLANLTLAMGEGNPFAQYLKAHVPLTNVRIVAYAGSVAKFLLDKDFAQQGYVFSEPLVARRQGGDPRALMLSDIGFNPYTGLVVTHRQLIETDPKLVARFVRATRRGWRRYLENPQQANAKINSLNPEMDLLSLAQATEVIAKLCVPEGMSPDDLGAMTAKRWYELEQQLVSLNLLDPGQRLARRAFTTRFLTAPTVNEAMFETRDGNE
jgi:NitT/TauT family transport system substrate-binding protein